MRKINLKSYQIATSETARNINRRIVLNLIRRYQPVSRADLARYSGLQRSTVSVITDLLIKERWVIEGAVGHLPRGRKPTFLHLNVRRAGIIGVNVRPNETTIGLARLDTSFLAQISLPTRGTANEFATQLAARLSSLIKSHPEVAVEGIGVSLPGRLDLQTHKLVFAPNLGWRDLDLKTPLERTTGLPVELENAANACALAEIWSERHSDSVHNLVTVTVSEGIGVGLILNGQLARGPWGMAGEFGHVSLDENGPVCSCGNRGCWEMYASNAAAVRYYEQAVAPKRSAKNSRTPSVSFGDILVRARRGDVKAGETLDRMAHYLGAGLAMLVGGLSPDVIVVVGEVTTVWDRMAPIIHRTIRQRCLALALPRIVATDVAAQPRLRGAIALILQKHFGAP